LQRYVRNDPINRVDPSGMDDGDVPAGEKRKNIDFNKLHKTVVEGLPNAKRYSHAGTTTFEDDRGDVIVAPERALDGAFQGWYIFVRIDEYEIHYPAPRPTGSYHYRFIGSQPGFELYRP